MKAQEQTQGVTETENDGRGVDDVDDENEVEEDDDDDDVQMDPSEKAAVISSHVRQYDIPKINFEATGYPDMIDWETSKLSEPPLTASLTNEQLTMVKETPLAVPDYPCHTQAVERGVHLVSEASQSVIGQEARDGFIRQRIQARKELKSHASKKDFFPRLEPARNDK